jgi:hypothetical protein
MAIHGEVSLEQLPQLFSNAGPSQFAGNTYFAQSKNSFLRLNRHLPLSRHQLHLKLLAHDLLTKQRS